MSLPSQQTLEQAFDVHFTDTRDNWKAKCPFHTERTPSFYIHKDDLVGHCFGCGVAGRLDVLVAKYQGISPAKAREALGLEYLPWLEHQEKEVEPVYPNSWIHAWKRISQHPYLEARGYQREAIEAFECRWDPTTKRVVFPHIAQDGRCLGAVGRATDGREPKYHFYWNCDKGQEVWTHREFWGEPHDTIYVVEGILDGLRYFQAGVRNVVALIGAAATRAQLRTIRESSRVIIGLDGDEAGRRGALGIEKALRHSCQVEFIQYPPYAKDAGDLGEDELREVIANPITPLQMKLNA